MIPPRLAAEAVTWHVILLYRGSLALNLDSGRLWRPSASAAFAIAVRPKLEARHRKCDGENCSKHSAVSSLGVMCLAVFSLENFTASEYSNPKASWTLALVNGSVACLQEGALAIFASIQPTKLFVIQSQEWVW